MYFSLGLAGLVAISGCAQNVLKSPEYLKLQSTNSRLEKDLAVSESKLKDEREELERVKAIPPKKIEILTYIVDPMGNGSLTYKISQEAYDWMLKAKGLLQYSNSDDGGNTLKRLTVEDTLKIYGRANKNDDDRIEVEEAKGLYEESMEKLLKKIKEAPKPN